LVGGLFLGAFLLGSTLRPKSVPMRIDHFCLVAGAGKRAAGLDLGSGGCRLGFARTALSLGFQRELRRTHASFGESRLLGGRYGLDAVFDAPSRRLRAIRIAAGTRRALRAFA